MLSYVRRSSTTSDRHAVDAFLPNIEPDTGKDFDALAESKAHTQLSMTSENAVSFKVDRSIGTAKSCFLSFMRFSHCKSTTCEPALGRAHAKTLLKTEDLTPRRKGTKVDLNGRAKSVRQRNSRSKAHDGWPAKSVIGISTEPLGFLRYLLFKSVLACISQGAPETRRYRLNFWLF
jgi:hypothetical protein